MAFEYSFKKGFLFMSGFRLELSVVIYLDVLLSFPDKINLWFEVEGIEVWLFISIYSI